MGSACQAKLMVSVGDKSHKDIHSTKVYGAPNIPPSSNLGTRVTKMKHVCTEGPLRLAGGCLISWFHCRVGTQQRDPFLLPWSGMVLGRITLGLKL